MNSREVYTQRSIQYSSFHSSSFGLINQRRRTVEWSCNGKVRIVATRTRTSLRADMNRRELLVNGGLAATGLLRRRPGLGSLLAQETPIAELQTPPPDPLVFASGGRVLAAKQWPMRRLE